MNLFTKLIAWFRPAPKTPEEIEAAQEGEQIRDDMESVRLSSRSIVGSNYQSGRASRHH